jgi:APA family basic amino acid/polyamine antiporter
MLYNSRRVITLARKLRLVEYFACGGVLGAILGFAIGGALLLPIGYVYGRLVAAMPDAAGEVAYTAKVFPQSISFATGWMMILAYFIVCPWEAVAVGRIAGYIFPALDSVELYRIAGQPVYLPHLLIGLGLTGLLTVLNYRGIRLSATFQNWTAFGTLALFVLFVSFGVSKGSPRNFPPIFTHSPFVSVFLVMQIVPYFMTGFESVVKGAEEASPEFRARGFLKAIWMAIVVGILFYIVVIASVGYVAPWKQLTSEKFMTAVAFEHAVGSRWIVRVILAAALLSLFKVFNGNFVAASRLLFAIGRRGLVDRRLGYVHTRNQTPSIAVVCIGLATGACMFLGDAILVPVSEVGSVASAIGWLAACAAYYQMGPAPRERLVAVIGVTVGLLMILMKVIPGVPGHFTAYEWLALGIWILLGVGLGWRRNPSPNSL